MVSHYLLLSDFGPEIKFSVSIHSIMSHGHMYIKYAQEELEITLGYLTENAIQMGNQQSEQYKHLFSRKNRVDKSTSDIFKQCLYIPDPILLMKKKDR